MHFDNKQDQNLRVLRNADVSEIQLMFSITYGQILSLENETLFEVTNKIGWGLSLWRSRTVVHDNIVKQMKVEVRVCSDTVLCLGRKCPKYPRSVEA